MMPWAGAPLTTAFTGFDRLTVKNSLPSGVKSPITLTVMTFAVSPGAKVTSPLAAW